MNSSHYKTPTIVVFLLVAIGSLVSCADEEVTQRGAGRDPVRVVVEPLRYESAQTRLEAVGTSRARRSIELHPAASGEVVAVNFEPGQEVKKDEILVELDSREERLAVELAEVRLADAERLFDRYKRTGSSGAVTQNEVDAASTIVETARIELGRAEVALENRFIEAPFQGHVDVTDVDPGDRINPDTLITTLDDRNELLVSFEVPEVLVGNLEVGESVSLTAWNKDSTSRSGEIVEVASRINPTTRTFIARATVANEGDELRPGMSFRVTINIEGRRYPVIAETAVQWGADGAFIWLIVNGAAKRTPIKIIQRQQGRVLIDADLSEGDVVVVEGIQRMREGVPVELDEQGRADTSPADSTPVSAQGN